MDTPSIPPNTEAIRRRNRAGRVLRIVAASLGAAVGLYLMVGLLLRPWYATWGATAAEVHGPLAGDGIVPDAAAQLTLAIDIAAPPAAVWLWLIQMGVDRAGLYTYTWMENGVMGLGVENADRIHPEWQDLKPGDLIAFTPEDYRGGRSGPLVVTLVPNEELLLCTGEEVADCPGTWQFVLHDRDDGTTRLVFRGRISADGPFGVRLMDLGLEPGYFMMERKMLLGIKERAERPAA
jgi:hypothetical protein